MADIGSLAVILKAITGPLEKGLAKGGAEVRGYVQNVNRDLGKQQQNIQKNYKNVLASAQQVGRGMTIAGGAIVAGLGLGVKAASDFESSFAGIRKTVDATEPEFARLREQILNLSTEIPVSANELARLGEMGGQLGVKTPAILSFTRTIADLGVATNLAGDEGATMLAQFANISKVPQSEYQRIGSTIVALGNNSATTENDIMQMAMRIAGSGTTIGLSAQQILGYAASLSSVGIKAEAGGTAISKIMLTLDTAVKLGGLKLKGFTDVAGVSAKEFTAAWRRDPVDAISMFIAGLTRLNAQGEAVQPVLKELKLGGIRVTDTLLRAGNAQDLMRETMALAGVAWKENTALAKEAAQRYGTFESQLKILVNSLTALRIAIGDALLPVLRQIVGDIKPVIVAITKWAGEHPTLTKYIVLTAGAVGTLLLVFGPLLMILPGLVSLFGLVGPAIGLVATAIGIAGGGGLAASVAALTPILATVTLAVGVFFAAWMVGTKVADSLEPVFNRFWNWIFKTTGLIKEFANEAERAAERTKIAAEGAANARRLMSEGNRRSSDAEWEQATGLDRSKRPASPGMATGGVVSQPIVLVGERGPEAVALPLGSRVMPHDEMARELRRATRADRAAAPGISLAVNLGGVTLATPMDVRSLGQDLAQQILGGLRGVGLAV